MNDNNGRRSKVQNSDVIIIADMEDTEPVIERFVYDLFGTLAVPSDECVSSPGVGAGWEFVVQGGRWDPDAAVYSFRCRDYAGTSVTGES